MPPLLKPPPTGRLKELASTIPPAWIAFFASLFLSAIAILGTGEPNRDGMLYIEIAKLFNESGFAAAKANFDWVFFPILIASTSKITGLGYETAAYLFNALLLAGVCATLVRITEEFDQRAAWSACLVALALPAINHYRDFLIREFGFWLFCLSAILFALRWAKRPTWVGGLIVQACLGAASLFRVEAAAFFVALALWQILDTRSWRQRLRRVSMLVWLPFFGGVLVVALMAAGGVDLGERISIYAAAANPVALTAKFKLAANQFADAILSHYSKEEAASILFFGLISMIPKKFLEMSGVFIIPQIYFFWSDSPRRKIAGWQPLGWFFAVYCIVLTAFLMTSLFLSARYVAFLAILTVPLIAVGLNELASRLPRWRYAIVGFVLLLALANVVSLSPRNTQYRQAGQWVAANSLSEWTTYIDDSSTGYYAGPAHYWENRSRVGLSVEQAVAKRQFEYYVFELSRRDAQKADWIASLNLDEVRRFKNTRGDAVLILKRKEDQ
ncbi:MAG: putative rane protein [Proteobacteria bacterium]|nr:putative rane protein [Pseudomonadota bacterium]